MSGAGSITAHLVELVGACFRLLGACWWGNFQGCVTAVGVLIGLGEGLAKLATTRNRYT